MYLGHAHMDSTYSTYVHTHIRTCTPECSLTAHGCQCCLYIVCPAHFPSLFSNAPYTFISTSSSPSPDKHSLHPSLLTLSRTIPLPPPPPPPLPSPSPTLPLPPSEEVWHLSTWRLWPRAGEVHHVAPGHAPHQRRRPLSEGHGQVPALMRKAYAAATENDFFE